MIRFPVWYLKQVWTIVGGYQSHRAKFMQYYPMFRFVPFHIILWPIRSLTRDKLIDAQGTDVQKQNQSITEQSRPGPLRGALYHLILLHPLAVRYFPFVLIPGKEGKVISKKLLYLIPIRNPHFRASVSSSISAGFHRGKNNSPF